MWNIDFILMLVRHFIPRGGQLIMLEHPKRMPAVGAADIDGDGIDEIYGAYKINGESYVIILKNMGFYWTPLTVIKGKGYDVTYLASPALSKKGVRDLIVGWQVGAIWSELDIFTWTNRGLKNIVEEDLYFSKLEVEDMPCQGRMDGRVEIAVWAHDTGDAYKVEIYKYDIRSQKLIKDEQAYDYYFKKVAAYYEAKVKEIPNAAFLWYYLADARYKAGFYKDALSAIEEAIRLKADYPNIEEMRRLKRKIEARMKMRTVKLYPASVMTMEGIKWGYIDRGGKFIIEAQYDFAQPFQENDKAVVEKDGGTGLIDSSGKYIVEPKYDSINEFSMGRAVVVDREGFKVIDENGKEIATKAYGFIGNYKDGRALFGNSDGSGEYLYGYLDLQGNEAIPERYKSANDFKGMKAVVKASENRFELISTSGETLRVYRAAFVGDQEEGLMPFKQKEEGKYGYINLNGAVSITPKYTGAQPFSEGRAVVNTAEDYASKLGLIDKRGYFVIKPEYDDISLLQENRVSLGKAIEKEKPYMGNKYAVADVNGNVLTDFVYYSVSNYKNGLASVYDDKNTYFIDRNGKQVKNLPILEGSGSVSFEGDIIKANVDEKTWYLDKSGKVIYRQNTTVKLKDDVSINEEKYKPNKNYLVYYPQIVGMTDKEAQEKVNSQLKELSQVKPIDENTQLDYSYSGNFSIKFFKNTLVVIQINGYNYPFGAAHGMPTQIYAHGDIVTGRLYELKDLFKQGSNYVKVLSDIIGNQIKINPEYSYVFPDTYKGISENQPFYVDENTLYIYFTPYEIAPYAAGFPTFKIPFSEIKDIIDTDGQFWKSFH